MPFIKRGIVAAACAVFGCLMPTSVLAQDSPGSTLFIHARVADGTGKPLRRANVRIAGGKIVGVGRLKPTREDHVIDARGLVLAPGFIDIHNHSEKGLETDPLAETQIAQGITTLVLGADGDSPWPIAEWREMRRRHAASLNVAVFAGHATIRKKVMGEDFQRVATKAEVEQMAHLTEQGMSEGAVGLSSGLEYEVGSYSDTNEVVAMASVAARHGGIYETHTRDEGNKSFAALDEEIAIADRAHIAVEHSHIKVSTISVWGKAPEMIRMIDAARQRGVDFLADCYPYDAWHSNIKVIMPDKQYDNPRERRKSSDRYGRRRTTSPSPSSLRNPEYVGHNIAELAKAHENLHQPTCTSRSFGKATPPTPKPASSANP